MSTIPTIQPTLAYYLGLFTSQYQATSSPNLQAFAALLLQPFLDTAACADSLNGAFNLYGPTTPGVPPVTGVQLDIIGKLVGVSRTLPFNPAGVNALTTAAITSTGSHQVATNNTQYMASYNISVSIQVTVDTGGNAENVLITSVNQGVGFTANFTKTHASGVAVVQTVPYSAVLDDYSYYILILATILQNQWNGQIGTLWQAWQTLFPGGHIYVTDNQNMTCTLFMTGDFSPVQQQMISNGLIVPRPEAVQYTYTFGLLPAFGFDGTNPALIAGFDVGYWS